MSDPVHVRPAATVLLVRDGAFGLEVFMVVRHHEIDFASGALVFPGGGVEAGDYAIAADPSRCDRAAIADERDRVSRVAALRETFEECGVLLARPRGSNAWVAPEIGGKSQGPPFSEFIAAENLELALGVLIFHMFSALAEFERALIRERTRAGLKSAKLMGRIGGRPPKLADDDLDIARMLLANPDITVADVADRLGVSPATLYRYLPAARAAHGPDR